MPGAHCEASITTRGDGGGLTLVAQGLLYVLCYRMEAFSEGSAHATAALRALPLDRFVCFGPAVAHTVLSNVFVTTGFSTTSSSRYEHVPRRLRTSMRAGARHECPSSSVCESLS